jgi:hypothetical protein
MALKRILRRIGDVVFTWAVGRYGLSKNTLLWRILRGLINVVF